LLLNNRTFAAEIAHNVGSKVPFALVRNALWLLSELNKSELSWPTPAEKLEPNKRSKKHDPQNLFNINKSNS
jgi:hypothetical protein